MSTKVFYTCAVCEETFTHESRPERTRGRWPRPVRLRTSFDDDGGKICRACTREIKENHAQRLLGEGLSLGEIARIMHVSYQQAGEYVNKTRQRRLAREASR